MCAIFLMHVCPNKLSVFESIRVLVEPDKINILHDINKIY